MILSLFKKLLVRQLKLSNLKTLIMEVQWKYGTCLHNSLWSMMTCKTQIKLTSKPHKLITKQVMSKLSSGNIGWKHYSLRAITKMPLWSLNKLCLVKELQKLIKKLIIISISGSYTSIQKIILVLSKHKEQLIVKCQT